MADDRRPLFRWRSVVNDSDLPPVIRHVLMVLSIYMNTEGVDDAHPGSARLARETGLHLNTVKRSLREAVKQGYLLIEKKGGAPVGGKRFATEYVGAVPGSGRADRYFTDAGLTSTGTSGVRDRYHRSARPVPEESPISSVISSENSGGVASKSPAGCVRCHGTGSFWDGMKQHACAHTLDERPTPPPWIVDGTSRDEWLNRSSNESV